MRTRVSPVTGSVSLMCTLSENSAWEREDWSFMPVCAVARRAMARSSVP